MAISKLTNLRKKIYNKFMKNNYQEAPSLDEIEKMTIKEVEQARAKFDDADSDNIDIAIYQLMAAEERLSLLIRERKRSNN